MKRRKGKKETIIDTSLQGFGKVGINMTDEQYRDFTGLNMQCLSEEGKGIPVFNAMLLLKYLGLLPKEMIIDADSSITEEEKKFGVRISPDELIKRPTKEETEEYLKKEEARKERLGYFIAIIVSAVVSVLTNIVFSHIFENLSI